MLAITKALIYSAALFGLLYFAYKKRDSKTLFHVIMVLCWLVIAVSMDSYDIYNYRRAYDAGVLRGKDPMFDLLQWIFSSLGVPFAVFKLLYGTTIWFLLYRGLKNFTVDLALAAALFAFGPMMGYGTQMRSSMAGAILLNAIPVLLKKDAKVWKYCAMVTLASLFHLMAVFYFVFLIPKYWKIGAEKFRNYMCLLALALIPFFLVFAGRISKLLTFMQTWTDLSEINSLLARLARYFSGEMSPNMTGFLYATCGHLVVFVIMDRMCTAMRRIRSDHTAQNSEELLLSDYATSYLQKINSIMVLFVPCYILSMQFDRFYAYVIPACYCVIVQGIRELRLTGKEWGVITLKITPKLGTLLAKVLKSKWTQMGSFELLVLLACLIFCFFVNNRFSVNSEFVRIVNGIGMFAGPK